LRFLIVGAANTILGLAVIYLAKLVLQFGDIAANALGYGCGLAAAFVLNASWTFDYRGRTAIAIAKYLAAFLIAYGANLLTVWYLIERAAVNDYIAQAAGILPYTLTFYLLCWLFVFRDKQSEARPAPLAPG
jgi:putative flippase GtrA